MPPGGDHDIRNHGASDADDHDNAGDDTSERPHQSRVGVVSAVSSRIGQSNLSALRGPSNVQGCSRSREREVLRHEMARGRIREQPVELERVARYGDCTRQVRGRDAGTPNRALRRWSGEDGVGTGRARAAANDGGKLREAVRRAGETLRASKGAGATARSAATRASRRSCSHRAVDGARGAWQFSHDAEASELTRRAQQGVLSHQAAIDVWPALPLWLARLRRDRRAEHAAHRGQASGLHAVGEQAVGSHSHETSGDDVAHEALSELGARQSLHLSAAAAAAVLESEADLAMRVSR